MYVALHFLIYSWINDKCKFSSHFMYLCQASSRSSSTDSHLCFQQTSHTLEWKKKNFSSRTKYLICTMCKHTNPSQTSFILLWAFSAAFIKFHWGIRPSRWRMHYGLIHQLGSQKWSKASVHSCAWRPSDTILCLVHPRMWVSVVRGKVKLLPVSHLWSKSEVLHFNFNLLAL